MVKNKKYILTMFGILVLFAGCQLHNYKNVIEDMSENENDKMLLLRDINTNEKRIYSVCVLYAPNHSVVQNFKYLHIGDTVTITTGFNYPESYYTKSKIFTHSRPIGIILPKDSIRARKEQEKFALMQQKMDSLKQGQLR